MFKNVVLSHEHSRVSTDYDGQPTFGQSMYSRKYDIL